MTRAPDPARGLLRALRGSAAAMGCLPTLAHEASVDWASATFVGAQHRVRVGGAALEAWLATLPEADLPMRGYVVADCAVERRTDGAVLTVLVLEE